MRRVPELVTVHQVTGHRAGDHRPRDHRDGCSGNPDLWGLDETEVVGGFLGPGHGGAGPTHERRAAHQQTVERVLAERAHHQQSRQVLHDQQYHDAGAQDGERHAAALQGRQSRGESEGREEEQQQHVAQFARECHFQGKRVVQGKRCRSHDESADHGRRDVEPLDRFEAAVDADAGHERDEADQQCDDFGGVPDGRHGSKERGREDRDAIASWASSNR
jgi:hypothetical protein